ncbi:MAG: hypothetical protein JSR77_04105 [Planctomycetes bacterium]|nr:hypothetical protein [Planctomycetota bacterium]
MIIRHWFTLALLALTGPLSAAEPAPDWLLNPAPYTAAAQTSADGREVTLTNGLVRRTFRTAPNWATVALDSIPTHQSLLRSVRPEATVTINAHFYSIGGLTGQPVHNYLLPEWLDAMQADPHAFAYKAHRVGKTAERFAWKPREAWLSQPAHWPPAGVSLEVDFAPPADAPELTGVTVTIHYELYDGVPLLSKWMTVSNQSEHTIRIDSFAAEILAAVEPGSMVGGKTSDFAAIPRMLHAETDYAFGGGMDASLDSAAARWTTDPLYETQVNYDRQTPCMLTCAPPLGPAIDVPRAGAFESFRVFELIHDSTERERRGLALRRMYRTIAPWVLENPLIFHAASSKPQDVRASIDQAAQAGFELVIMTFGSGFNIENTDEKYLASLRELCDYAHSRGVALGGYSLLASRSIDAANDVINPATGKPGGFAAFGNSPCLGSDWGNNYFRTLYAAFEKTGMDVLEHDGSYPGDACASASHPGHRALEDSQWTQWRTITGFYQWCRARGIYLNVPDWYFLSGSSKSGMGYRETNWSLPRDQQEIIERQNIFDGTWNKAPSMGWMFVPLTQYHGGGPAATIEPLDEHLDHYERRLANLLGAGVQACYRGPRLFDTDRTRDMVKSRVAWFKQHRAILESDIIHGRRADGRDLDWILHVNPSLKERGMLMVYNPSPAPVTRSLDVNLYYTGLTEHALVTDASGRAWRVPIAPGGAASIEVNVPAHSSSWYVIQSAAN